MLLKFIRYLFAITLGILYSNIIFAEDTLKNIVRYFHLNIENGLASRQVNCGFQDSQGFVWLGTTHGLQRYDGKNFKTFTKEKNGLQDNVVTRIIEDTEQRLWIMYGLYHGEAVPTSGKVDVLDLKTNKILPLAQAFKGKLPFDASDAGLIYSNENKEFIFLNPSKTENEKSNTYWNVYHYSNKKVFKKLNINISGDIDLYYKGDYLFSRNIKTSLLHRISDDKDFDIKFSGNYYYNKAIYLDNKNIVHYLNYTPAASKLYGIDINKLPEQNNQTITTSYKKNTQIKGILLNAQNADDAINFETGNCISLIKENATIDLLYAKDWKEILNLTLYNYFVTKDGIHWLCTNNGLYKITIRPNKFKHLLSSDSYPQSSPLKYQTRNIFATNDGKVILNSWGGCYVIKDVNKNPVYEKIQEIPNIFIYTDGVFFDGENIYKNWNNVEQRYNIHTKKIKYSTNNFTSFWAGIKTKNGQNIISNFEGAALYKDANITPLTLSTGKQPPKNWIQQFYYTKDNLLWAVGNNGIFCIDNNNVITKHYTTNTKDTACKIPYNDVNSMHEDKNGILWLATNENGLVKWNRQKNTFENFTRDDGLSSNLLYGILEDERGLLWISSDYGLMCFNPNTNFVKTYTTANGITNNEFNRCAFTKANDGRMFFGGMDGVNTFYPKDLWTDVSNYEAPIKIVSFYKFSNVSNKLLDFTDELIQTNKIILNPEDNFFTLEFQLQDYNSVTQRYAYKIDGIDKDWIYINENSIRLSGLAYGDYTLKIKAQNQEGAWSTQQLNIPLKVLVPIQNKWWFQLLVGLGIIGIFVFLQKKKTDNLAKDKRLLEATVNSRTIELNKSLVQKEVLLKEIHHRVKNNLTIINSLLDLQSSSINNDAAKLALLESQNRVKSIALIHQRLYQNEDMATLEIRSFVEDVFREIATVFGNKDIKVEGIFDIPFIQLDLDTAVPVSLIINELITNSFKYAFNKSEKGIIEIIMKQEKEGSYTIFYADNGPGFSPDFDFEKSKSLGLRIIKLLSRQLNGNAEYKIQNDKKVFVIDFEDSKTRNQKL